MRSKIATPMPGSAMWEIASAANVIRRITAKHPTKPAAAPAPMDSRMALRSSVIVNVIGHFRAVEVLQQLRSQHRLRGTEAGVPA